MKHLTLNSGQGKNGKVNDHNDENTENTWAGNLACGFSGYREALFFAECSPKSFLFFRQPALAVFNNDHGSIDDDSKVDRAQTEKISADSVAHHAGHCKQHGKRDH